MLDVVATGYERADCVAAAGAASIWARSARSDAMIRSTAAT